MNVQEIRKKIDELQALRSHRRNWRVATGLSTLGIIVVCLLIIRNAAMSLFQDGPAHDEFVAELTHDITRQVFPQMTESGIQASGETLPAPDAVSPIDHNHASQPGDGADETHRPSPVMRESPIKMGEEKAEARLLGADNLQKPLGRFREQIVSEYENTVTRIVSDLAAIRGVEGTGIHAGLPADAVASLFVSRVQEGLPGPAPEDHGPLADSDPSKDSR